MSNLRSTHTQRRVHHTDVYTHFSEYCVKVCDYLQITNASLVIACFEPWWYHEERGLFACSAVMSVQLASTMFAVVTGVLKL